jgi:L-seryl-tRNA(Ser) seleniumtransferase
VPELRDLPSVHEVLDHLPAPLRGLPHALLVYEIRHALEAARAEIQEGRAGACSIIPRVERGLATLIAPSLRGVINATGVVLHTNLGRAPLGEWTPIRGYSNLEYDLATAKRGNRDVHIGALLERLLGRTGIAVNNNAAAVYLALHELAGGYEVLVSRGELIEIGDGFRIPEIMRRSGAILREVGTTNRTHIEDYRAAINDRTRLLMRVHPSNFRIEGFTSRPQLAELVALAREHSIPLYEDLGSGCIADLAEFGIDEPVVSASLKAGVDLLSFSGDKLLGGPQAGILAGDPELVRRLRRNPMFRALRLDKFIYQALEATLRRLLLEQWEQVPALAMIRQTAGELQARSERLSMRVGGTLLAGQSVIGGGSTPQQSLATWLIALDGSNAAEMEQKLRANVPPVIARIVEERVVLDLRTVFPEEEEALVAAVQALSR